jgi:hypothetical protein
LERSLFVHAFIVNRSAAAFCEGAHFLCASWKRVRIFEEIIGIFQDAHFSKPVRIFERGAHLRQGSAAVDA